MPTLKLKTAPVLEPISMEEAKLHLRVDNVDEEAYISTLILAARTVIEDLCGPLITQTWEQYDQEWPDDDTLIIGKARLLSVTSIVYTLEDGTSATLSATTYTANTLDEYWPGVTLKPTYTWPTDSLFTPNPIKTTFTCGYGTDPNDVPQPLRHAMLLLIGHWYENREIAAVGRYAANIPWVVGALIASYRVWHG